jgi:hypothetical protein
MFELEDFAQGNVHGLQVHKLSHFSVFGHSIPPPRNHIAMTFASNCIISVRGRFVINIVGKWILLCFALSFTWTHSNNGPFQRSPSMRIAKVSGMSNVAPKSHECVCMQLMKEKWFGYEMEITTSYDLYPC